VAPLGSGESEGDCCSNEEICQASGQTKRNDSSPAAGRKSNERCGEIVTNYCNRNLVTKLIPFDTMERFLRGCGATSAAGLWFGSTYFLFGVVCQVLTVDILPDSQTGSS